MTHSPDVLPGIADSCGMHPLNRLNLLIQLIIDFCLLMTCFFSSIVRLLFQVDVLVMARNNGALHQTTAWQLLSMRRIEIIFPYSFARK